MGTTPTYSWPYPEPTDPVANGAQDIEDLALAVESTVSGLALGKVVQVVHTHKNSVFSTTSTSYVDVTGLSATITPTSASSTVLVMVSLTIAGNNDNARGEIQLVRGSTAIGQSDSYSYFAAGLWSRSDRTYYSALGSTNIHFEDSPATTSATTYKIQVRDGDLTASTIYVNRARDNDLYRGPSSITLLEVGS